MSEEIDLNFYPYKNFKIETLGNLLLATQAAVTCPPESDLRGKLGHWIIGDSVRCQRGVICFSVGICRQA